jgi:hypothetical protein
MIFHNCLEFAILRVMLFVQGSAASDASLIVSLSLGIAPTYVRRRIVDVSSVTQVRFTLQ